MTRYQADVFLPQRKVTHQLIQEIIESPDPPPRPKPVRMKVNRYVVRNCQTHNCDVCYIELIQDMTKICLKIKFWNVLVSLQDASASS